MPPWEVGPEQSGARAEVEAIIASGLFASPSKQVDLLRYLLEKMESGRSKELKEYTVAVELFQKTPDFDSHVDATVRVQAHRLRAKLAKYYATTGRDHPVKVGLPPGQYELRIQAPHASHPDPDPLRGQTEQPSAPVGGRAIFRAPRKRRYAFIAIGLAGVLVAVLLFGRRTPAAPAKSAREVAAGPASYPSDPEPGAVRIAIGHSGDPYLDHTGRRWQPDRYFEGGTVLPVNGGARGRTSRPELFRYSRVGASRYRIPLPPGEYEVRLYVVEPDWPAVEQGPDRGYRIFGVRANGVELASYDLLAQAGYEVDIQSFAHVKPDRSGILQLESHPVQGDPAWSAIEVLPMPNGAIHPVRIIAQTQSLRDKRGNLWLPDDFYRGGKHGIYQGLIAGGALGMALFSGERIGDFDYFIPVPAAAYTVNLYFAETWFGQRGLNHGSFGSRIFNVLINNEIVLRNFEMLREAPANTLIKKTWRGVKRDRHGQIHVGFVPLANWASVRAIEVIPEQ